jgi:hypothetical protein
MDEFETSASDSDYANSWVSWFLGCKGNEYFCEIDEEYITDRFNLTYLNTEVHHYSDALELITDSFGNNTLSLAILIVKTMTSMLKPEKSSRRQAAICMVSCTPAIS